LETEFRVCFSIKVRSIRINFSIAITITLEKSKSKSAEKISIRVCLRKVKLILNNNNPGFTKEQSIQQPVFNQSLLKIFQSKLD